MILKVENISDLISKLRQEKFHGTLSLQFRGGEITLVRQEQTFLTDEFESRSARNSGSNHHVGGIHNGKSER